MSRIRVGVSKALVRADAGSGHGRAWSSTLAQLRDHVRLVPVALRGPPGDYRVKERGLDVWLADGHAGHAEVDAPVVAVVHEMGWTPAQLRGLDDSRSSQPLASRTAAGVGCATQVITPSETSRREVIDRSSLSPGRVHSIAYGVDRAVFRPAASEGRSIEAPYLLFVGGLQPRKNVFALRKAVAGLARRGHPHVLAMVVPDSGGIVASEPREAVTAELPGLPGRVVVLPHPSDPELAALMAGADAFCLPSLGEGFGLPALEAMACGAVVVVSDRGSLPEVVGDGGLVVSPTPEALEAALGRVLDRPHEFAPLRERALLRARQFDWARTARGWLRVLELAVRRPVEPRASARPPRSPGPPPPRA